MVCVGAKIGTERTSASDRSHVSRAVLNFHFPFIFSLISSSSCSTTKGPSGCDTRRKRPTRPIHTPSRSHCLPPLFHTSRLTLSDNTLGQHLPTPSHYHAAAVRTFLCLFYLFPLLLIPPFNPYHRHPQGRRYDTILRHS